MKNVVNEGEFGERNSELQCNIDPRGTARRVRNGLMLIKD